MRTETRLDSATITRRAKIGRDLADDLARIKEYAVEHLGAGAAGALLSRLGVYHIESDAQRLAQAPTITRCGFSDPASLESEARRLERYTPKDLASLRHGVYDAVQHPQRGSTGQFYAVDRVFTTRLGGDPVQDWEHAGEATAAEAAYRAAQKAGEALAPNATQEERAAAAERLMREGSRLQRLGVDVPG